MDASIESIAKGPRESNFELLRIIAMLMVLILHSDFKTFGIPSEIEIDTAPWGSFGRIFVESFSLSSVNIFIMISGWFGIKTSLRGCFNFLFQVIYFYSLSFFITWICGINDLSITNILHVFCLPSNGWFIISYLGLYILAPVYNTFLNIASKQVQRNILLSFFILQTVYGFVGNSTNFNFGYSTLSFSGLYLLAGYVRRHIDNDDYKFKWGGVIVYVSIVCVVSAAMFFLPFTIARMMQYTNPLLVISSLSIVVQCSKIHLKVNKTINFIAASAFSVYLLHENIFISSTVFLPIMKSIGCDYGVAAIVVGIVTTYLLSIILDQPRKLLWRWILNKSNKCIVASN